MNLDHLAKETSVVHKYVQELYDKGLNSQHPNNTEVYIMIKSPIEGSQYLTINSVKFNGKFAYAEVDTQHIISDLVSTDAKTYPNTHCGVCNHLVHRVHNTFVCTNCHICWSEKEWASGNNG